MTSTPRVRNERLAAAERASGRAGRMRGPDWTRIIRAVRGSAVRNSSRKVCFASSAIAPASSTPVAPPPTRTKVSRRCLSAASAQASALSNAARNGCGWPSRHRFSSVPERRVPNHPCRNSCAARPSPTRDNRRARGAPPSRPRAFRYRWRTRVPSGPDNSADPQQCADRHGDVGGRQGGGGDLVEQGLEQVVMAAIDDGDPCPGIAQRGCAAIPPKPAPTITTRGASASHAGSPDKLGHSRRTTVASQRSRAATSTLGRRTSAAAAARQGPA